MEVDDGVRLAVADGLGVFDGVCVKDGVGGTSATVYVWIMLPLSTTWPTESPKKFWYVIVAPFICKPSTPPVVVGLVLGKLLNRTTFVRLYTPPRSTRHHPDPSHASELVMSLSGDMLSKSMTPEESSA